MKDINDIYFQALLKQSQKQEAKSIVLKQPEKDIDSEIIPLAIANDEDLESINIQKYSDLSENISKEIEKYVHTIVKMQAGLGTSVERMDLIQAIEGREKLGAKGTDLYFEVEGKTHSIAELQLRQAIALSEQNSFKKINYVNLVNEETLEAVEKIWKLNYAHSTYENYFTENSKLEIGEIYFQKMMPTLDEKGELTHERLAPAGHGFVGFAQVLDVFNNTAKNEIVSIGNGEDLSSTPDIKIINWMIEEDLPIVMMTTTKTEADKKGGQISIVKSDTSYVAIIEKAQADSANQTEYFEELGLRKNDRESLFNTNIVIINKKALKDRFNQYLQNISLDEFIHNMAPDVIFNQKVQDGKTYTQLESALGSVMLNLDKYFRISFNTSLVSFLNLAETQRELFFMPIKKREDYESIKKHYKLNQHHYRLEKRD